VCPPLGNLRTVAIRRYSATSARVDSHVFHVPSVTLLSVARCFGWAPNFVRVQSAPSRPLPPGRSPSRPLPGQRVHAVLGSDVPGRARGWEPLSLVPPTRPDRALTREACRGRHGYSSAARRTLTMATSHPSFRRPPLVETALAVQFKRLKAFRNAHLGLFWSQLASEYPITDDAESIMPQFERFGDERPVESNRLPRLRLV